MSSSSSTADPATYLRRASHSSASAHASAGWYEGDGALLSSSLSSLLSAADHASPAAPAAAAVRAVVATHAGLRYSGATAAFAYRRLCPLPAGTRRVVVLGPSHHVPLEDALGVSRAHVLATPVGDLAADTEAAAALLGAARAAGVRARWR